MPASVALAPSASVSPQDSRAAAGPSMARPLGALSALSDDLLVQHVLPHLLPDPASDHFSPRASEVEDDRRQQSLDGEAVDDAAQILPLPPGGHLARFAGVNVYARRLSQQVARCALHRAVEAAYVRAANNVAPLNAGEAAPFDACLQQISALLTVNRPDYASSVDDLLARGRVDDALACARQAEASWPRRAEAHELRARALRAADRHLEADFALDEAIAVDGRRRAHYIRHPTRLDWAGAGQAAHAMHTVRYALGLAPNDTALQVNYAHALLAAQRPGEVLTFAATRGQGDPHGPIALPHAQALLQVGDVRGASHLLREAVAEAWTRPLVGQMQHLAGLFAARAQILHNHPHAPHLTQPLEHDPWTHLAAYVSAQARGPRRAELLEQSQIIDPRNPELMRAAVEAWWVRGEGEKARQIASFAILSGKAFDPLLVRAYLADPPQQSEGGDDRDLLLLTLQLAGKVDAGEVNDWRPYYASLAKLATLRLNAGPEKTFFSYALRKIAKQMPHDSTPYYCMARVALSERDWGELGYACQLGLRRRHDPRLLLFARALEAKMPLSVRVTRKMGPLGPLVQRVINHMELREALPLINFTVAWGIYFAVRWWPRDTGAKTTQQIGDMAAEASTAA